MHKKPSRSRVIASGTATALLASVLAVGMPSVAIATSPSISVDFSTVTAGSLGHYGAGILNAINDGTISRSNNDYANLNPLKGGSMFRGGRQLVSGPSYDYFDVVGRVTDLVPQSVQLIPTYYYDQYPTGWTQFQVCEAVALRALNLGVRPDIDIMNEPDLGGNSWSWYSSGSTDWDNCYDGVRAADPTLKIVGPSITSPNLAVLEQWLSWQDAKGRYPDILAYHFSDSYDGVTSDVAALRAYMVANSLPVIPISINEVLTSGHQVGPGEPVNFMAAAETAQVTMAHACWGETAPPNNNTCLQPMLDGLLDNEGNRRGAWYAYADYMAMSGSVVSTSSSSTAMVNGLATKNSTKAVALIGANDSWGGGPTTLNLSGLSSLSFLGSSSGNLRIVVQQIQPPAVGVTTIGTQYVETNQIVSYSGNSLSTSITLPQYGAARITILPSTSYFTEDVATPNINVAVTGTDGHLYYQQQNTVDASGTTSWAGWVDSGVSGLNSDPSYASSASNNQHVFFKGSSGDLQLAAFNGVSWVSGGSLGGPTSGTFLGSPSSVYIGYGNSMIAVRGNDNHVWVKRFTSIWSSWQDTGYTSASDPSVVEFAPGDYSIFYLDSSGTTQQITSLGNATTWTGPVSRGGTGSGKVAAVSDGPGRVVICIRETTTSHIYCQALLDGWWTGYLDHGFISASDPALATRGPNLFNLQYVAPSGHVMAAHYDGVLWSTAVDIGAPPSPVSGNPTAVN